MIASRGARRSLVGLGAALAIALTYVWAVLRGLDFFVWHDDEPVLVLTARALMRGHELYRDVWYNYAPGLAHYLRIWFEVLGYSLATARLSSLAAGLVSLIAVWCIARAWGGHWGGLGAALFLAAAPHFVALSSAALAEVPTFGLVALSVLWSVRYGETALWSWLAASGATLGLAVSFKPTALPVALVPFAAVLLVERSWRRRLEALILLGLAGVTPMFALVLLNQPADFLRQFLITWRNSRGAFPYEPWSNLRQIGEYFCLDKYGLSHVSLLVLAIVGWLGLRRRQPTLSWLPVTWAGGLFFGLLFHTPLYRHHLLALLGPVCVLAGVGLVDIVDYLSSSEAVRQWLACLLLVWVVLETRGALWASFATMPEYEADQFDISRQAVAYIVEVSSPGDYVLTDAPILAIRANRDVPVETINTSRMRVLTGQLSKDDLVRVIDDYAPTLIIFWERKLDAVPGFDEWVAEQYDLLRDWDGRHRLYVRKADLK